MIPKLPRQFTATAAIVAVATGLMIANSVSAEPVKLKSTNGLINLSGMFVDFTDNDYIIRTPLGELHISAGRVSCEGSACPPFNAAAVDLVSDGSDAG